MTQARFDLPTMATRRAVGLVLAALIAGSWLALHAYAMFVFELSWASLPQALVMAAVQCWLSVGVFIVCHDAMHGSLAPGWQRLNAGLASVLLFLYAGFRWRVLRDAHFVHHKLAGHAGDPDFDEDNPASFARWYATFFKRYFGWQSLLFVHAVVGVYWLVIGIPMVQIVLLYGAPALLSSLQLFYFGTYRPHYHRSGEAFADSHNARTDGFGRLASLITCFHFGYHLEHHRRPDVPWWALPSARAAGIGEVANQDEALA
ncbi:fatty acid desaturase [uncultured Erythrobacter sp.]|uniref:fatty acid desaturase n=1 Tax=uncultured Erythrobacter sp. TaxID=263913 RepID=UPI0026020147|nr:fatty acid desaturase [uncultured Erythrobacter sp.]